MRQFFQRYHALRVFGSSNQVLRYSVVGIFLKLRLPSAQLAEATTTIFRANRLQSLATEVVAFANTVDLLTGMGCAITISSDSDDTKIDTDHAFHIIRCRFFPITYRKEVELALDVDQIRFTTPGLQQFPVPPTTHEWNGLPTVNRPDGHRWLVQVPAQDAVIIRERPVFLEGASSTRVDVVRIGNLSDAAYNQLGRQIEGCANMVITQLLNSKLTKHVHVPGHLAHRITCRVRRFKRAQQGVVLLGCWLQFELCNQFHTVVYSTSVRVLQAVVEDGFPPLPLKRCGFQPYYFVIYVVRGMWRAELRLPSTDKYLSTRNHAVIGF